MGFYNACIAMVQELKKEMSRQEQLLFMDTPYTELWQHHFSVGWWIRNHYLKETDYLHKALLVLDKGSVDEMSLFLLEFAQQYLRLEQAGML